MPTYLIIEERNAADELVAYQKYNITEPADTSLIPLPEPNTALQIARIIDLKNYYRRCNDHPLWFEACAALGAIPVPEDPRRQR